MFSSICISCFYLRSVFFKIKISTPLVYADPSFSSLSISSYCSSPWSWFSSSSCCFFPSSSSTFWCFSCYTSPCSSSPCSSSSHPLGPALPFLLLFLHINIALLRFIPVLFIFYFFVRSIDRK
ncbi:hypothetical protein EGW08_016146 [Elysia chlorotica]|uniref:Uncharacterized protein n=1 Tax=Elysia chlorotica TaxID=188477 RepID=A0A3S0ZF21_ELYCH|nr:hypothetical protein EGW08_016146 [Elysia chlorotica]